MIIDKLLAAIFAGISALLTLIPDVTLPFADVENNGAIGSHINDVARLFPLLTFIQAMGFLLGLRIILQGWDFLVWVYHQFWGAN